MKKKRANSARNATDPLVLSLVHFFDVCGVSTGRTKLDRSGQIGRGLNPIRAAALLSRAPKLVLRFATVRSCLCLRCWRKRDSHGCSTGNAATSIHANVLAARCPGVRLIDIDSNIACGSRRVAAGRSQIRSAICGCAERSPAKIVRRAGRETAAAYRGARVGGVEMEIIHGSVKVHHVIDKYRGIQTRQGRVERYSKCQRAARVDLRVPRTNARI